MSCFIAGVAMSGLIFNEIICDYVYVVVVVVAWPREAPQETCKRQGGGQAGGGFYFSFARNLIIFAC